MDVSGSEGLVCFLTFNDGKITSVVRFGDAGFDCRGEPAGSIMTMAFEFMGRQVAALNGGPHAPHPPDRPRLAP